MASGTISFSNADLLWENPSAAEFAGQTIQNLDLSPYRFVAIVYARYRRMDGIWASIGNLEMNTAVIPTASETGFNTRFMLLATSEYGRYRPGSIQSNAIDFENAIQYNTYGNNTETTNNSACIPYRIYGLRNM